MGNLIRLEREGKILTGSTCGIPWPAGSRPCSHRTRKGLRGESFRCCPLVALFSRMNVFPRIWRVPWIKRPVDSAASGWCILNDHHKWSPFSAISVISPFL
ncbi:hypothetical protein TNCT_325731 [Trichonephila clavata]|uniref:Uncharacterized protein n=1 Tax=Trichonephila clavata TaxID=2740835 RepID=A0A8X6H389_TRICU|nr:hypothetical protein TNCT_325731 [Trichonephila clavata]